MNERSLDKNIYQFWCSLLNVCLAVVVVGLVLGPNFGCADRIDGDIESEPASTYENTNVEEAEANCFVIAGRVAASEATAQATNVVDYQFKLDLKTGKLKLNLIDVAGISLGEISVTQEVEEGSSGYLQTNVVFVDADGEITRQTTQTSSLNQDDFLGLRTAYEAPAGILYIWEDWELNNSGETDSADSFRPKSVQYAVAADSHETIPGDVDQIETAEGKFYVYTRYQNEHKSDDEELNQWLLERGFNGFIDSSARNIIFQTLNDYAWVQSITNALQTCKTQRVGNNREETQASLSQSLQSNAFRTKKQGQESSCQPDPSGTKWDKVKARANLYKTRAAIAGGALTAVTAGSIPIFGTMTVAGWVSGAVAAHGLSFGAVTAIAGLPLLPEIIVVVFVGLAVTGAVFTAQYLYNKYKYDEHQVNRAESAGDPHMLTFDGLAYNLQAVGEFVLVEAFAGKPLQIQVRQQAEADSRCPNVSYNTAVAARLGGYRVTVDSRREDPLWIDGEPSDVPAGFLPLGNGDGIFEVSEGHYRFRWADNSLLDVKISLGHLSLATLLSDSRLGQVHGLLGRYNGDRSDDLALRDGTILEQPVKWFDLYEKFAQSWRIDADESLFDYEAGETTETFTDVSAPGEPTTLDDLPDDDRATARQTCEDAGISDAGLLDDCTMDVYCTADDSYAGVHARRAPADEQADVLMPIFLDGWLQQGDPANGNWDVSESGRSVTQSVNGDPTFFVSPQDYFDTTIRGTFEVDTSGDDDFIGFVFGYQAPLAQNGDATDDFKTFLLSWKQTEQSDSGNLAQEGFTLAHVDGTPANPLDTLWGHQETPEYQVLGTDYGDERGWDDYTPIEFTLEYGAERIRIWIDEELIFDISAAEAGVAFEPGRFGFYNFSQSDVIYSDFNAQER